MLKSHPKALLYAGGTDILREKGSRFAAFPAEIIVVSRLNELRQVVLTERFIELGAAITMAEILELRENAVPELLALALRGLATPAVRNLATIGGNLACSSRFLDSWPALACLDALVEIRDAGSSRWINVSRLADENGLPALPYGCVLTRLRIPLEPWDAIALRKVGNANYPSRDGAVFALAARSEKGILTEFRLAFAGQKALRLREIEGKIVGRKLPLGKKERESFASEYREAASPLDAKLRFRFGALVDGALDLLSR